MDANFDMTHIFRRIEADSLFDLFAILIAGLVLIIAIQRILPWVANRLHGRNRLTLLAAVPPLRLFVIAVTVILSVPHIVVPSWHNMLVLLGTVGLALGFALKDYVSSLFAGLVAVGERPYRNGDWINMGGVYGEVVHIGMRAVLIVTPDDTTVYVPHMKLWSEVVANSNNGGPNLQCVVSFHLHPDHDVRVFKQALENVAITSAYLQITQPIQVVVEERPWGTHYRLRAYPIDPRQQFRFSTDLSVRGKEALSRLGAKFSTAPTMAV